MGQESYPRLSQQTSHVVTHTTPIAKRVDSLEVLLDLVVAAHKAEKSVVKRTAKKRVQNARKEAYKASTSAPPVPRNTFERAPLKKARVPSFFEIFTQASSVFLYWIAPFFRPDCIIMRRLTVSNGYEVMPEH